MNTPHLHARADERTLLQLHRLATGPKIQAITLDGRALARLKAAGLVSGAGKLTTAGRARVTAIQAGQAGVRRPEPKPKPMPATRAGGKLPRIYA